MEKDIAKILDFVITEKDKEIWFSSSLIKEIEKEKYLDDIYKQEEKGTLYIAKSEARLQAWAATRLLIAHLREGGIKLKIDKEMPKEILEQLFTVVEYAVLDLEKNC